MTGVHDLVVGFVLLACRTWGLVSYEVTPGRKFCCTETAAYRLRGQQSLVKLEIVGDEAFLNERAIIHGLKFCLQRRFFCQFQETLLKCC